MTKMIPAFCIAASIALSGCDYPAETQKQAAQEAQMPLKEEWQADERTSATAEEAPNETAEQETDLPASDSPVLSAPRAIPPTEPAQSETDERSGLMVQPGTVYEVDEEGRPLRAEDVPHH